MTHEKSKLTFYTEQPHRDSKHRAARQHVLPQDRCMARFLAVKSPLHLDARCADLMAAHLAAECPDGGRLKCLGFSAAFKFMQREMRDSTGAATLCEYYRRIVIQPAAHVQHPAVASELLLMLLTGTRPVESALSVWPTTLVHGSSHRHRGISPFGT